MKARDNMAWGMLGNIMMVVHNSQPPTDTEFAEYAEDALSWTYKNTLVWSDGGGPTTRQRGKVKELWVGRASYPKGAVLTASRIVRGIVTATNWLLGERTMLAFGPDDFESALAHFGDATATEIEIRAFVTSALAQLQAARAAG